MSEDKKWVYSFHEGDGSDKRLLGGKGANLCEMTQMGLRVPPGFIITTQACLQTLHNPRQEFPEHLLDQVHDQMAQLEKQTGRGFGQSDNPLLVSVRSGSAISMPGMMDTILNLGLNSDTLQGLIKQTGNERFGYDSYRRFIQLFGKVAMGIADEYFDDAFEAVKRQIGANSDVELKADDLRRVSEVFLDVVRRQAGRPFPHDVYEQLEWAIHAVFKSWMGKRAVDYRRQFNVTPEIANGTAVNVCVMVFGNMGNDGATGVGFTRNPATGENVMYGEYLTNAQGEDVVAGIRTPKPVAQLAEEMPEIYNQLEDLRNKLETHYREVQDFEYTIEKGVLYCLQTRNGKMNATARVRTAVEMADQGLLTREEALLRVDPDQLDQLLHPRIDPTFEATPLADGLPASPGAASGRVVFDADRAELLARDGEKLILVREETKPEDIHGFFAAQGVLTSRGGKTSHAAVVARGMGKPCVAGAGSISVDVRARRARIGERVLHEGDVITIDGGNGKVYDGEIPTVPADFTSELQTLLDWADQTARLSVLANADTPEDAKRARELGAKGIGLCRTERMFNALERLPLVLDLILAEDREKRKQALDRLLPIQREDFKALFETMSPYPVTVRLLDPPIHEFLPTERELEEELTDLHQLRGNIRGMNTLMQALRTASPELIGNAHLPVFMQEGGVEYVERVITHKRRMLSKVRELFEINPMLGHRGVRLGITFPEIYEMQIQAILEAAAECLQQGTEIHAEIMVPQVCTAQELLRVKVYVDRISKNVQDAFNLKLNFKFGTMIEVVRACMRARNLAEVAEFFSFGTNDLTQATFSFSREDAENKFLPFYNENKILQDNPFEVLDVKGVGQLMKTTVKWGRESRPDLIVGICGEQGGHPASIQFLHAAGLDYVSCSPLRVPVARLAAAQAKLRENEYDAD